MAEVTNSYEVWDGTGQCHDVDSWEAAAAKVSKLEAAGFYAKVRVVKSWPCQQCKRVVVNRGGRDETCECGAEYTSFGQRLRDDWRGNPSNWDDNVSDLEGFEIQQLRKEGSL